MSSTSFLLTTTTIFLLLLLLVSSHPLPISATKPPPSTTTTPPPPRAFKRIFAFGDSFTDTGNTRSVTGPSGFGQVSNPPYGVTYFHHSTNRYSDGRLVIDFVTEYLSLPFLPPYLSISRNRNNTGHSSSTAANGVNFAVAGATAINYEFFAKNNLSLDISPHSILSQLVWFNKYLESEGCGDNKGDCKEVFEESLFWIGEIGVNDYAYTLGSTVTGDVIQRLALNSVTAFLESLLKRGAKYMIIQGLPASGCLPLAMYLSPENDRDDIGCVGSVNNQSYSHNAILQDRLCNLRKQYPDSVVVYADYWKAYHTVMKNAAKYGFKNKFDACCGSGEPYNFNPFATCGTPAATLCSKPSEYINWDGVHLTEAMYKVVSNMFLKGRFSHPPFSYLMNKKLRRRG